MGQHQGERSNGLCIYFPAQQIKPKTRGILVGTQVSTDTVVVFGCVEVDERRSLHMLERFLGEFNVSDAGLKLGSLAGCCLKVIGCINETPLDEYQASGSCLLDVMFEEKYPCIRSSNIPVTWCLYQNEKIPNYIHFGDFMDSRGLDQEFSSTVSSFETACLALQYCNQISAYLKSWNQWVDTSSKKKLTSNSPKVGHSDESLVFSNQPQMRVLKFLSSSLYLQSAGVISQRLGQICNARMLGDFGKIKENDYKHLEKHLRLKNIIVGIMIDVVIGMFLSLIIFSQIDMLSAFTFEEYKKLTFQHFYVYVDWLSKNPAGLKLNPSLTPILSRLIIYFLETWRSILLGNAFIFKYILSGIAVACVFGVSLGLAMMCDLIRVITFHIRFFYIYLTKGYFCVLYFMGLAYSTMRGKRIILPGGLDINYSYDVTSISASVVCFSTLVLIFPTVFMYYMLFATVQISVELVCITTTKLANIFTCSTVYSAFLQALFPYRFPGKVGIRLLDAPKADSHQSYYEIYASKFVCFPSKEENDSSVNLSNYPALSLTGVVKAILLGRLYWK